MTIYAWRRQDRINRGLVAGLTSGEKAELTAARERPAEWRLAGRQPPSGRTVE